MDRRDPLTLQDSDQLVFVATAPEPEPEIYDYPGDYAQRFDGIESGGFELAADTTELGMDYANSFQCIPDG